MGVERRPRRRALLTRLPPSIRALVARGLSIFASFLLTLVVARSLSVQATGSFFVVYTLGAVAASFGRYGVDNLAIKILGRPGNHRAELRHGWLLVVAASTAGGVLLGLTLAVLRTRELGAAGLLWAAAAVPPQALAVVAGAILRGRGRLVWGILAELGSIPAFTSFAILVGSAVGRLTLDRAIAVFAGASFLTAAWSVPMAVSATGPRRSDRIEAPDGGFGTFVRRRGGALSSMMGASLVYYTVAWAPILTLTVARRVTDVAMVTVASRLANLVTLVPAIQVSYLAPQFSQAYHTGRLADLNALARASSRRALALLAAPAVVLAVCAQLALRLLYGPGFAAAAPLLIVLVASAFVVVGLGQVNQLMLICDLERWALLLSVVVVVAWSTAGLWLANAHGAGGVVLLAAVSSLLYAAAAAAVLVRKRGIRSYV